MKTKKRVWQIILAVVMGILTAIAVTGCSSTADTKPATNSSAASSSDDSLSKIKELSFDALLTTLQSGQVDVIISGLSATEERRKTVEFSDTYYKGTEVLLTTKENLGKFNNFSDLKDKKIGIQLSSLQDKLMHSLLPDGKYTTIESMNTLFLSLKSNQIDGIVTSKIVSQMAVTANPDLVIADKVEIDDSSLNSPGVAVALRKGTASLQTQINGTVKRLKDSGQMQSYVDAACKLAGASQAK